MNTNKNTAIDLLINIISEDINRLGLAIQPGVLPPNLNLSYKEEIRILLEFLKLLNEYKNIEKQQINDAVLAGIEMVYTTHDNLNAELYYEKTYNHGNNKQQSDHKRVHREGDT